MDCSLSGCPWDSPSKNIRVGCYFPLQRIFPVQEMNLGLLHCRQILYWLSYEGSPLNPVALLCFRALPGSDRTESSTRIMLLLIYKSSTLSCFFHSSFPEKKKKKKKKEMPCHHWKNPLFFLVKNKYIIWAVDLNAFIVWVPCMFIFHNE